MLSTNPALLAHQHYVTDGLRRALDWNWMRAPEGLAIRHHALPTPLSAAAARRVRRIDLGVQERSVPSRARARPPDWRRAADRQSERGPAPDLQPRAPARVHRHAWDSAVRGAIGLPGDRHRGAAIRGRGGIQARRLRRIHTRAGKRNERDRHAAGPAVGTSADRRSPRSASRERQHRGTARRPRESPESAAEICGRCTRRWRLRWRGSIRCPSRRASER